jgi:hypothetical protein
VAACQAYARIRKGEDPQYTKRLKNWLGEWEQWIGAKPAAKPKPAGPTRIDYSGGIPPSIAEQAYYRPPILKEA